VHGERQRFRADSAPRGTSPASARAPERNLEVPGPDTAPEETSTPSAISTQSQRVAGLERHPHESRARSGTSIPRTSSGGP
jgi:hypothetical protein